MASKVKYVTPFGVAEYPHLNTPDSKGKRADNKYKTKLRLRGDNPDTQAFVKKIDAACAELKNAKKVSELYRPYTVDEETGDVIFVTKSKYAPAIFDAKNHPARKVKIGRGSTIRLTGELVPFDDAPNYPDGGINARLHQVQIKELQDTQSAFDEVDGGYEYDPDDAADDEAVSGNSSDESDSDASEGNAALDI